MWRCRQGWILILMVTSTWAMSSHKYRPEKRGEHLMLGGDEGYKFPTDFADTTSSVRLWGEWFSGWGPIAQPEVQPHVVPRPTNRSTPQKKTKQNKKRDRQGQRWSSGLPRCRLLQRTAAMSSARAPMRAELCPLTYFRKWVAKMAPHSYRLF